MNGDDDHWAVPDDCRLQPDINGKTTFQFHNRGDDANKEYVHADILSFKNATLYRSKDRKETMLHVDGLADRRLRDENHQHFERGYSICHKCVYVFEPITFQDLCANSVDKKVDLKIFRYVQNQIPMYHFSPKTPLAEKDRQYNYEFNMSESDFQKLKKVNSDPCYRSDEGYRIVSLENGGVVVTVNMTKLPMSKKEEATCHVRPSHSYSRMTINSTKPYTTKAITLPHTIEQDYKYKKRLMVFSNNVYCISYTNTVVVWVRPDVALKKIEYVTDNGVAFSNTYSDDDARAKVLSQKHCVLSGPADRCNWLEKCGANKYCSLAVDRHHECKCKKIFATLNGLCVTKKVCTSGFKYVKKTNECEDIDECNASKKTLQR
ncbi:hypothetical protein ElyMa_001472000 [Elysia marginata]|uniref:EGF-like domain-containing protein n=1 Tax=Elysia marginata TaxID=1093978 RepID=A0AAV4J0W5_9GAST|nr:hypothetical protein ElyMa_001472000 [Elysia marginata]